MTKRWRELEDLVDRAIKLEPNQRAVFLDQTCGADAELRREVESLLEGNHGVSSFLKTPAMDALADELSKQAPTMSQGQRIGHYIIREIIGRGGMGEVYRAHDPRLGRDVAIKCLPAFFAADGDRLNRLAREARILAALNHPNIAAIYGLEEKQFLVMELVEGKTLAERLKEGRLAVEESLKIALQIVDALQAAHEKGVIHRDVKPANIKITADGRVKVLDFGLAKAPRNETLERPSSSPTTQSQSDTLAGVILGTAGYMSPEQATGKVADRTSDVWTFGCLLYEMLTGRAVFQGQSVSELLAAVLKEEPDWKLLPAETPAAVLRLLRRCLAKNPQSRLHDMADVRIEIEEALSEPSMEKPIVQTAERRWERSILMSTVLVVTLIAAVLALWLFRAAPLAPEVRLEINTPPTFSPNSLAIAPDGQKIVFQAVTEGGSRLWLRPLDSVSAVPLAGTEGAQNPFWSPNSRSVGFFADGKLKRLDIDGGSVQTLANVGGPGVGGAWNSQGVILFAGLGKPIFRVPDTGGEPVAVTRLGIQEGSHFSPQFLPDQNRFLYFVRSSPEMRGIYVGHLDGTPSRRVFDAEPGAVYTSTGQLLYTRQGTLFAQDFDPVELRQIGTPYPVARQLAESTSAPAVSVTSSGFIAYRTNIAPINRELLWFDSSGMEVGRVGVSPNSGLGQVSLSPDQRRVAGYRAINGNTDIWLIETDRGAFIRFTSDPSDDIFPVWSPDGNRIVFSSNRKGVHDLYLKSAVGGGGEELLLSTDQGKRATDWSSDGRFLLFINEDSKTILDIWALPLNGAGKPLGKPFPVVQTNFEESFAQFSPDGKFIAYQSDESGRAEIYVQPFPGPGNKWPISTNGGSQVRWRQDTKGLFYIGLDGRLMAVSIRLPVNGGSPEIGAPEALFVTRLADQVQQGVDRHQYIVADGGQRFLMAVPPGEVTSSPINVILNWKPNPNGLN